MASPVNSMTRMLSRRPAALQCLRTTALPSLRQRSARYVAERGSRRIGQFKENQLNKPLRNPYDEVTAHRKYYAEMHADKERIRILVMGAVVCVAITIGITVMFPLDEIEKKDAEESEEGGGSNSTGQSSGSSEPTSGSGPLRRMTASCDAPGKTNETFRGREVVVAPGGEKLVARDEKTGEELQVVPTGTSSVPHFPKTIYLPSTSSNPSSGTLASQNSDSEEYTLIGLGIRTVSFLSIQVYVVGFYVQTTSLQKLQAKLIKQISPIASALIPGEKEKLKHDLLDPEQSLKIWETLLRDTSHGALDGVNMALRVVPTRSTDFNHLRDGWIRAITTRTQDAQRLGSTEYSDDSFGAAKKEFERLLSGKGKAPRGSVVILTRNSVGRIGMQFQEKENADMVDMGGVEDERIARLVWLGYLGGKNVSSENARKGVVDGLVHLVERPVGTVETQVL